METRKFWCHYIGSDGNTPKRRNIELTNLADLIPAIGDNKNCATPLWYEKEVDNYNHAYYHLYAQLSDTVAVFIIQCGLSDFALERVVKTDEQIEAFWKQWIERQWADNPKNDVGKAKDMDYVKERSAQEREERDRNIERIKLLQDYDALLLSGSEWISGAAVRAYEEAQSPYLPVLQEMRRVKMEERDARRKEQAEKDRLRREEEARKKAEAERQEQERLTQEAEKFKAGESISGEDVVELCRRYNIAIHLRTVHNLQQVVTKIDGKGSCYYRKQPGKRRPQLDGCFRTAEELYQYLKTH